MQKRHTVFSRQPWKPGLYFHHGCKSGCVFCPRKIKADRRRFMLCSGRGNRERRDRVSANCVDGDCSCSPSRPCTACSSKTVWLHRRAVAPSSVAQSLQRGDRSSKASFRRFIWLACNRRRFHWQLPLNPSSCLLSCWNINAAPRTSWTFSLVQCAQRNPSLLWFTSHVATTIILAYEQTNNCHDQSWFTEYKKLRVGQTAASETHNMGRSKEWHMCVHD